LVLLTSILITRLLCLYAHNKNDPGGGVPNLDNLPELPLIIDLIQRPGLEADHSPPSSAEVKNAWRYTSTTHYVFVA